MTLNLPSRAEVEAELKYRAEHRLESFYPETGEAVSNADIGAEDVERRAKIGDQGAL